LYEFIDVVFRSLWISGSATLLASLWSIPLAYYIAYTGRFKNFLIPVFDALIGVPTILIGLLIYMVFCNHCILGIVDILYTPYAIIIGESILITPLITTISYRVLEKNIKTYGELVLSLGGSEKQVVDTVLHESLTGLIATMTMGFSRAIGELGIALIVGGNIKGYTRVITTAIALLVSRGELEEAVFLGLILVLIVVIISFISRYARKIVWG